MHTEVEAASPVAVAGRGGVRGRSGAHDRAALAVRHRREAGRAGSRQHEILAHLPATGAGAGDGDRAVRTVVADAGVGQPGERDLVARTEIGDGVGEGATIGRLSGHVEPEARCRRALHRAEGDRPRAGRGRTAELKGARHRAAVRTDRGAAGVGAGPRQRLRATGDRHAAGTGDRPAVAGRTVGDGQGLRAERRPAGARERGDRGTGRRPRDVERAGVGYGPEIVGSVAEDAQCRGAAGDPEAAVQRSRAGGQAVGAARDVDSDGPDGCAAAGEAARDRAGVGDGDVRAGQTGSPLARDARRPAVRGPAQATVSARDLAGVGARAPVEEKSDAALTAGTAESAGTAGGTAGTAVPAGDLSAGDEGSGAGLNEAVTTAAAAATSARPVAGTARSTDAACPRKGEAYAIPGVGEVLAVAAAAAAAAAVAGIRTGKASPASPPEKAGARVGRVGATRSRRVGDSSTSRRSPVAAGASDRARGTARTSAAPLGRSAAVSTGRAGAVRHLVRPGLTAGAVDRICAAPALTARHRRVPNHPHRPVIRNLARAGTCRQRDACRPSESRMQRRLIGDRRARDSAF